MTGDDCKLLATLKQLIVILGLLSVPLSACQSTPTRLFSLEPVAPTSIPSPYQGPAIRLEAVHVPPALDRTEISSEVAPGEFIINELDHWVAPLGQLARQALAADLITRLPPGRVIFPHLSKPADAMSITVDLLSFNVRRGVATLQVSWVGMTDLAQRRCGGTLGLQAAATDAGSTGIATALSILLAQLAERMVVELMQITPADPLT